MKIIYDGTVEPLRFGVEQIKRSLWLRGIFHVEQFVSHPPELLPERGIVIGGPMRKDPPRPGAERRWEAEAFTIRRQGGVIFIEAGDVRGLLYGCLEWAERIGRGRDRLDDGERIDRAPRLAIRGVKFNLPYVPFEYGEPFTANLETCLDIEYWRAYLDMLALNRYNCLSLWSEHPFHLMVVSPRFREANPHNDTEIDRHIRLWTELMRHARNRGIDVYLFTWNVRLIPEVAKGLGLPESVGRFAEGQTDRSRRIGFPLNRFRQSSELIKDYFREMVLQLLLTYPDLKGLGVSASEWMDGDGYEKETWICETYLQAIRQSGRDIPFIHRTNTQSAGREIKDLVQPQFDPSRFYISWKYSNAHAYSHPQPQFERLWNAWDGIDLESTQILYTVRNDDVHTHRWGDPEYVRKYVEGMAEKPYVKGFYWGSDGYVWGPDFQHAEHGHKTWVYDFERHLFQFQLWGRLSYDPQTDRETFRSLLADTYGETHAGDFLDGLEAASKIIPAVNRLFWLDYDMQWHPESCLSHPRHGGFKTVLDFVYALPMPGVGVMGIREFARAEQDGTLPEQSQSFRETPPDIIEQMTAAIEQTESVVRRLTGSLGDCDGGHLACTRLDLAAMGELGRYYICKFSAALELNRYEFSRRELHRERAVDWLTRGSEHWRRLGELWSRHNKPYQMARVKMTFGYPLYTDHVDRDIELARRMALPD